MNYWKYVILVTALASCTAAPKGGGKLHGNYFTPRYAEGFCLDTADGKKILTVVNPFQGANAHRYTYPLSADTSQRIVCMSTTQLGFLDFIGKSDAVVGVSGAKYIFNPAMQAAYQQGKITDVGYEQNLIV
jgi:iron complex transport system substrate-binding protein